MFGKWIREGVRGAQHLTTGTVASEDFRPGDWSREAFEAYATLQEVILMPRDLQASIPDVAPGEDVVVFVHGFMASPGVFRPLRRRIERELLVKTASFAHVPGAGVEWIADQLKELVERFPRDARVHIVGHSLGGFVARWYVQELGGDHVVQTISLGSPFGGTKLATGLPILVGADLHPKSQIVRRIRRGADVSRVPHLSVVGDMDRMVVPVSSAMLPKGDVEILRDTGHNGLLYDPRAQRLVCERVLAGMRAANCA
jgi:triacylglycerol lipase